MNIALNTHEYFVLVFDNDLEKLQEEGMDTGILAVVPRETPIAHVRAVQSQFTHHPLKVLGEPDVSIVGDFKVTWYTERTLVVALAGNIGEPTSLIRTHLDQLVSIFKFFHGSFEQLEQELRERYHAKEGKQKKQTTQLRRFFRGRVTALFQRFLSIVRTPHQPLHWINPSIPRCSFTVATRRCYLDCSEMLSLIKRRWGFGAASILFKNRIVTSTLPQTLQLATLVLCQQNQETSKLDFRRHFAAKYAVRLSTHMVEKNLIKVQQRLVAQGLERYCSFSGGDYKQACENLGIEERDMEPLFTLLLETLHIVPYYGDTDTLDSRKFYAFREHMDQLRDRTREQNSAQRTERGLFGTRRFFTPSSPATPQLSAVKVEKEAMIEQLEHNMQQLTSVTSYALPIPGSSAVICRAYSIKTGEDQRPSHCSSPRGSHGSRGSDHALVSDQNASAAEQRPSTDPLEDPDFFDMCMPSANTLGLPQPDFDISSISGISPHDMTLEEVEGDASTQVARPSASSIVTPSSATLSALSGVAASVVGTSVAASVEDAKVAMTETPVEEVKESKNGKSDGDDDDGEEEVGESSERKDAQDAGGDGVESDAVVPVVDVKKGASQSDHGALITSKEELDEGRERAVGDPDLTVSDSSIIAADCAVDDDSDPNSVKSLTPLSMLVWYVGNVAVIVLANSSLEAQQTLAQIPEVFQTRLEQVNDTLCLHGVDRMSPMGDAKAPLNLVVYSKMDGAFEECLKQDPLVHGPSGGYAFARNVLVASGDLDDKPCSDVVLRSGLNVLHANRTMGSTAFVEGSIMADDPQAGSSGSKQVNLDAIPSLQSTQRRDQLASRYFLMD
eukprot:m.25567 g.25567  ORF g.25567 m.25567 type:complete len:843 (-) comp8733_c0_seq1:386-2914(-)